MRRRARDSAARRRPDRIMYFGERAGPADRAPQARGRSSPRKGRAKVLASIVVVAGLAGLCGIGYSLLHRAQPPATPTVANTSKVHAAGPAATVRRYFTAINHHNYREAWVLVGRTGSFANFAAGYAGTAHDMLTNFTVSGNVVSLTLHAIQTDGSVKVYQGSYTVLNGVIIKANVQPVS